MALFGQLAALGTALCWSFTAIFFSYSGRLVGSEVVNRTRLVFALLFLSLTHFALQGTLFPRDVALFRWGWLGLSGILGLVLGDTFLFQAFVLVGPRMSTLTMASVPIWSTFLAWLFLGETMTAWELTGILLTVAGIAWVVTERRTEQAVVADKQYGRGLFYGFLGALGQAANLITAKFGLVYDFPTISATWIRILVALIVLWTAAGLRGKVRYTLRQWRHRQAFPAMVAGTLVGPFLGIWLSLIAVQLARVGIASTLMALPPVFLIPLGYLLYREQVSLRGITGTLVALGGVALIFLPS